LIPRHSWKAASSPSDWQLRQSSQPWNNLPRHWRRYRSLSRPLSASQLPTLSSNAPTTAFRAIWTRTYNNYHRNVRAYAMCHHGGDREDRGPKGRQGAMGPNNVGKAPRSTLIGARHSLKTTICPLHIFSMALRCVSFCLYYCKSNQPMSLKLGVCFGLYQSEELINFWW